MRDDRAFRDACSQLLRHDRLICPCDPELNVRSPGSTCVVPSGRLDSTSPKYNACKTWHDCHAVFTDDQKKVIESACTCKHRDECAK